MYIILYGKHAVCVCVCDGLNVSDSNHFCILIFVKKTKTFMLVNSTNCKFWHITSKKIGNLYIFI